MAINLTNSYRDRQRILNNPNVIQKIEKHFNFDELFWDRIIFINNLVFTRQQLELLFSDVSTSVIERYIKTHLQELQASGHVLLENERLEQFLLSYDIWAIKVNTKTTNMEKDIQIEVLELFTFKAWLNIVMLLSESKKAEFIRSRVLDIVIDTIAEKEGDRSKHICRVIQYSFTADLREYYSCSKVLYDAVNKCLGSCSEWNTWTDIGLFAVNYDKIYEFIFGDQHQEYRQVLELNEILSEREEARLKDEASYNNSPPQRDRLRVFLYSEIKNIVEHIEDYIAKEIQTLSKKKNRRITAKELDEIVLSLEYDSDINSSIEEARMKMDWKNLPLKNALSKKLEAHYKSVAETDLNEFIAAKNKSLKEKLSKPETLAVFQRLKDR